MSKPETAEERKIREEVGSITRTEVLAAIRSIKDHGVCHHAKIQRYARCNVIKASLLICYLSLVGIVGDLDIESGERKILVDIKERKA